MAKFLFRGMAGHKVEVRRCSMWWGVFQERLFYRDAVCSSAQFRQASLHGMDSDGQRHVSTGQADDTIALVV